MLDGVLDAVVVDVDVAVEEADVVAELVSVVVSVVEAVVVPVLDAVDVIVVVTVTKQTPHNLGHCARASAPTNLCVQYVSSPSNSFASLQMSASGPLHSPSVVVVVLMDVVVVVADVVVAVVVRHTPQSRGHELRASMPTNACVQYALSLLNSPGSLQTSLSFSEQTTCVGAVVGAVEVAVVVAVEVAVEVCEAGDSSSHRPQKIGQRSRTMPPTSAC